MKAQNYATFFENIDATTSINEFEKFIDLQAKFKDPFHEVQGIHEIYWIFRRMYQTLDNPKFKILEVVEDKNIAYIKWQFSFCFKKENEIHSFNGVSRVIFNAEYKAISHEDFWDASENIYGKLPLIKYIIAFVKNKIRG
jgi:hypothetical protein